MVTRLPASMSTETCCNAPPSMILTLWLPECLNAVSTVYPPSKLLQSAAILPSKPPFFKGPEDVSGGNTSCSMPQTTAIAGPELFAAEYPPAVTATECWRSIMPVDSSFRPMLATFILKLRSVRRFALSSARLRNISYVPSGRSLGKTRFPSTVCVSPPNHSRTSSKLSLPAQIAPLPVSLSTN